MNLTRKICQISMVAGVFLALSGCDTKNPTITDSEESAHFLAVHCAIDRGGVPDDYMGYCRKLATTLSQFSGRQQRAIMRN